MNLVKLRFIPLRFPHISGKTLNRLKLRFLTIPIAKNTAIKLNIGKLRLKQNIFPTLTLYKPGESEVRIIAMPLSAGPILRLLAPVNIVETWTQHFSTRSWNTIGDQLNAGYPFYAQPGMITGSFEDIFDFGAVFTNVILTANYAKTEVAGTVDTITKIATSTDGINYTAFVTETSIFISAARYVKLRLEFTASDDKGLATYTSISVGLNIKLETDSGNVSALASDATGTQVNFGKPFKDVNSITTTALSLKEPLLAFYDFTDAPNPTGFRVYVIDSDGNRKDATVSWKARGLI